MGKFEEELVKTRKFEEKCFKWLNLRKNALRGNVRKNALK